MPGRDRMGPKGQGPMTGRGIGRCGDTRTDRDFRGDLAQGNAFGLCKGRGQRRGCGFNGPQRNAGLARGCFGGRGYASQTSQNELEYLKDYTRKLEEALNATKARMTGIEGEGKTE